MARITVELPDDLSSELDAAAREEGRTQAELIREGIDRMLHSKRTDPSIPLFARRIGPLAIEHGAGPSGGGDAGPG